MNPLDWLKQKAAEMAVRKTAEKFDTKAEAEAAVTAAMGGSMNSTWIKSLAVTFFGGAATSAAAFLTDPESVFAPGGLRRLAITAAAGGLVALAAFLKQSPIPPKVPMILLCLLFAGNVRAEEPPVSFKVAATGEVNLSDGETKVSPGITIGVSGPIAIGGNAPASMYVEASILQLPGESESGSLEDPSSWRTLWAKAGVLKDVGRIEREGQDVRTSLEAWGAFATRLGSDPAPLERYVRAYGAGVRLSERRSGAYLSVAYGHDDAVSDAWGRGHLLLSAAVPLGITRGIAGIQGRAALAIGRPEGVTATDRLTIGITISPPASARTEATARSGAIQPASVRARLETVKAAELALAQGAPLSSGHPSFPFEHSTPDEGH